MALMVTPVSRAASPILTLAIIRRSVDGEASRQVDRRAGECAPAIRHREHRGVGSWLSRPFGAGATLAARRWWADTRGDGCWTRSHSPDGPSASCRGPRGTAAYSAVQEG